MRLGMSTARSWNRTRESATGPPPADRKKKDGAMPQISRPFSFPGPTEIGHRKRNLGGLAALRAPPSAASAAVDDQTGRCRALLTAPPGIANRSPAPASPAHVPDR